MTHTVLVVGYVWPEPNSSAAGRYMLSLLRLFKQQNWHVVFSSPAQTSLHQVDLDLEGIESQSISLNCDSFNRFAEELDPDIVVFDRFMMEEQFGWRIDKACPNAMKILDTEDLQCLRFARHQAVKQQRTLSEADYFSDIAKREIAAILRCDLSLIISPYEIRLLQDQFKVSSNLLHHHPFMVSLDALPDKTPSFDERKHFVSIGNFRHAPNWDATLQLKQLWPAIRKQLPQVECHLYGAYPPPKATALHDERSGFLIKGWADNAHDVLSQSRVCLAPLRFGAGLKGKLLDAMETGTPSVTTDIGSEGMADGFEWPGQVTSLNVGFTDAAVALYQNSEQWHSAQQNAHPILQKLYDSTVLSLRLISEINRVLDNLTSHRLNNFTGAMLKHHSLASTQYMSQWIAAKNQH